MKQQYILWHNSYRFFVQFNLRMCVMSHFYIRLACSNAIDILFCSGFFTSLPELSEDAAVIQLFCFTQPYTTITTQTFCLSQKCAFLENDIIELMCLLGVQNDCLWISKFISVRNLIYDRKSKWGHFLTQYDRTNSKCAL